MKNSAITKIGSPSSKVETRRQNEHLILESAEKIFAIHGFKGSSTMQIAKEAGLPKANIHYYFETKAKLYECVLGNMLEDWMSATRMFKMHGDPAVTLSNYVGAKMDLARQRPNGSKVWATEIISGAPVMRAIFTGTFKGWVDECVATIEQWVKEEKIIAIDAKALLYMIWATTQHYADFNSQIIALNDNKALSDKQFEEKKQQVIKLILSSVGLKTD